MIDFEALAGTHGGKDYGITWRSVRPDHLAILPAGLPGACSVAAGCGAPRVLGGPGSGDFGHSGRSGEVGGSGGGGGSTEHGGHAVGDMVKFSTPSIHYVSGKPVSGKSSQAGLVKRLLPGGKMEVKSQQGGYHTEHHTFFQSTKKALSRGDQMPTKLDRILRALGLRADDAAPEVDEKLTATLAAADPEYNGIVEFGSDRVVYIIKDGALVGEVVEVEPVTRYEPLASALDLSDLSSGQLQALLADALGDDVNDFGWVQDVFPSSRRVVYSVNTPSGVGGSSQSYQRTYSLDAAGNVALSGDIAPVEMVTTWEALAERAVRTLVGKRHSSSDQKMVQTVHDHAVSLGAECAKPAAYAAPRKGFATLAEINQLKGSARSTERRAQGE